MLSERSLNVLKAIVHSYIANPEPVGSRYLTKRYGFTLSPATIRNIMADLEEMGYLYQPHTSAGRVPTDRAFRQYVDMIELKEPRVDEVLGRLKKRLKLLRDDINDLLSEVTVELSGATNCLVFAVPMRPSNTTLNRVQLYSYRGDKVAAFLLTNEGLLSNRVLKFNFSLTQKELDRISEYLNSEFTGHTIDEIRDSIMRQMSREKSICDVLITKAVKICEQAMDFHGDDIIYSGLTDLIGMPEFADKIESISRALEDKRRVLQVLEGLSHDGRVSVIIGRENHVDGFEQLSIVSAEYRQGDRALGRVGMIGPTRMDYERVIPLVEATAKFVTSVIVK